MIWGKEAGDNPPPSHAWSGLLIVDMFQEGIEEWIIKAVIFASGEAILFFGRQLLKEWLPLGNIIDVGFSLMGHIKWASRTAYEEATVNTVQAGCQAIADAVVEKRTKVRGPGHPHRMTKVTRTPTIACNIEE